jgi:hypothetical protein
MRIPIYQVDAFTQKIFGGNPAAVCPLRSWLPDGILQAIAAENNLSETAFFVRAGEEFELRWFTPLVEIDLCGQVCSESAGTRHLSGTGGQLDFTFGAYRSKGGKAFLCLSSTREARGAVESRIRPLLSEGAITTVPRAMVSYVATEYGMVNLKGMSTWERAEALISIAHPQFQEGLIRAAEQMGIWRRRNRIA